MEPLENPLFGKIESFLQCWPDLSQGSVIAKLEEGGQLESQLLSAMRYAHAQFIAAKDGMERAECEIHGEQEQWGMSQAKLERRVKQDARWRDCHKITVDMTAMRELLDRYHWSMIRLNQNLMTLYKRKED